MNRKQLEEMVATAIRRKLNEDRMREQRREDMLCEKVLDDVKKKVKDVATMSKDWVNKYVNDDADKIPDGYDYRGKKRKK